MLRVVDDAHPAFAEDAEKLVRSDRFGGRPGQRVAQPFAGATGSNDSRCGFIVREEALDLVTQGWVVQTRAGQIARPFCFRETSCRHEEVPKALESFGVHHTPDALDRRLGSLANRSC